MGKKRKRRRSMGEIILINDGKVYWKRSLQGGWVEGDGS